MFLIDCLFKKNNAFNLIIKEKCLPSSDITEKCHFFIQTSFLNIFDIKKYKLWIHKSKKIEISEL